MYDIIVSVLTNLFRLYIIKRFIYIFFDSTSINKKLEIGVYTFFYLFTTTAYLLFHCPTITTISNILGLYLITLAYHSSQKKKLLIVCIIHTINMVCDMLCVYLLSDYMFGGEQNINSAFITILFISVCEMFAEKIIKSQKYSDVEMKHWKTLIIIPLCSTFMLFILLMDEQSTRIYTVITCIGILIINMIVFYLYNALINSYLLLEENTIFKQQTEIYSKQLDILMKSDNKIRSLQHDMKHHMLELNTIAQKEQAYDVMEYISHMNEFVKNPEEYVYSGNKDIDSILNYMIHNAIRASIKVNVKLSIPENIKIKTFDLNVILGNLLDNAIQALQEVKDKFLNLVLSYEKGILYIDITNNYSGIINKKNNSLLTTKQDKINHGIGLSNVKRIVAMYNGTIDIEYDDIQFKVEVMLYTPNL